MVRPAWVPLRRTPSANKAHDLFGWEPTSGIVSVDADLNGRARVWRRVNGEIQFDEHAFPNWFLTTSLDLLAHLPARQLTADWLRAAHGHIRLEEPLAFVELDSAMAADEDAYRYLVLTTNLRELETTMLEMANKRAGDEAQTLADLRGLVLIWDPIEQFLTLTGRTYFKDMAFDELRRFQFDLETTGLDEDRDRIFMISMRDSTGWRDCLEVDGMTEADVLRRFVAAVQTRDPDTLENHNIFGFDLSFLVKRAARLDVRLALGRDASEPRLETDVFDSGDRPEPFLRWRVTGREVLDTQHAVRRFGLSAPDMRRHGLKEAARYFGFATDDREYVPGAEIWPTYRIDPERIRRYAADDVDEVDGLSKRLLPTAFDLTRRLPRSYERVAANTGAAALWELLLVRAYLHDGRAIHAPLAREQRPHTLPRAELFVSGVLGPSAEATLRPLLSSVLAERAIGAANDNLGVMPRLVRELLDSGEAAAEALASAAPTYLGQPGLFADPATADQVYRLARSYLDRLCMDLRARGCTVVEVSGDRVVVQVPEGWAAADEAGVAAALEVPAGVEVRFGGHCQALYTRAAGTAIRLTADGSVILLGPAFRAGRLERFGEAFMQRAAPFVLRGDAVGLRSVFVETVRLLRSGGIALSDLCLQVTLHKSPTQYRRGGTREEPYEVLLAAGIRSWRVGQRIRYFRARGGEPRLLGVDDDTPAMEADSEYYIQRLRGLYCQQFAQAFRREDFAQIFRIPPDGDFVVEDDSILGEIRPIATTLSV